MPVENSDKKIEAGSESIFCKQIKDTTGGDTTETVFSFTVPFDEVQQQVFMLQYGTPQKELKDYFQNVLYCINRHVQVAAQLHEENNGLSVLYSRKNTSESSEDGNTYELRVTTEHVVPLLNSLFVSEIDLVTLLEVMVRLATILRDVAKAGIVHRGLDLREVYLSEDRKIRLGGFYYAAKIGDKQETNYLPECPPYLKMVFHNGEEAHPYQDIRCAATILYNLLSGLPWDTQWKDYPSIKPEYAPDCVLPALELGLTATKENFGQFRKMLWDSRKILVQEKNTASIPIAHPLRKEYKLIEEVSYISGKTAKK